MSVRSVFTVASAWLLAVSSVSAAVVELDLSRISSALTMGEVVFPNGHVYRASVGFGSGAFRRSGDAPGVMYAVTDRGPNIDCAEAGKIVGMDADALCAGDKDGKIFPFPDFSPTIYTMQIEGQAVRILETTTLKDRSGRPLGGLPNPLRTTDAEAAYDAQGRALPLDPQGLDVEAIVRAQDGTFWLAEEYGPSLVHADAEGRVLARYVPKGIERDLAAANYPVKGTLPAVLAKRKLNRGIESLGLSPDGKTLYAAVQSPLANPDAKTAKLSRWIRVLAIDAKTGKATGEYVYPLDDAETFTADRQSGKVKQGDVKVSELTAVGTDRLVVLERISKTTKFYRVDLSGGATNILGSVWDDATTTPSLEQTNALADAGIVPLTKTLLLEAEGGEYPDKIESIALMGPKDLILVNDNDFGIAGERTRMIRVGLDQAWE